jgi:hypothetical protein
MRQLTCVSVEFVYSVLETISDAIIKTLYDGLNGCMLYSCPRNSEH